jgi:tetratricopeptide (TPR) repeat protein
LRSFFLTLGCSDSIKKDFNRAAQEQQSGHYRRAAQLYDRVISRDSSHPLAVEAMKEAARISFLEIKDYSRAARYYKLVIQFSPDENDRMQAQNQLASLYFEGLQDYANAAIEYSKLASSTTIESERAAHKLSVARSYYYLGNYFQTLSEISEVLKLKLDKQTEFHALLLNGNVFVAQKKFFEAAKLFEGIISKFPDMALLENVHLILSLAHEESGDYKKALATLEQIKPVYKPEEYLELRIKRIQERAKNQPGAKGFRK